MKRIAFLCLISILSIPLFAQQFKVSGNPFVYNENIGGSGLQGVYLLNNLSGITISYASSAVSVKFYHYTSSWNDRVLISASDITTYSSGGVTTYTISNLVDNRGYLVEENGTLRSGIWIFDYSRHLPSLISISPMEDENKCELLRLIISKTDDLFFYGRNGGRQSVVRRYTISYNTLEWDATSKKFKSKLDERKNLDIGTEYVVDAPLIDTKFTLRGDQIAEYFGITKSISSSTYQAVRVQAQIDYEIEERDSPNEINKEEGTSTSFSAPVRMRLFGYGNEPVTRFYTWFVYRAADLRNPISRSTDRDINYEFNQSGDFVVKLEVADASSLCVDTASVSFKITESKLEVPNYFSPGDSPGSNDEFRVAYKSLVRFKCTIFNRWGVKLYEWNDPAKGWDGRYKGSFVAPGVYFYVIDAMGSDGIHYKKGGDINILRSR
ncbi:gliding motility-associated C-terminal domain-containing protein [Dysgonomonas sp. ZJ279]|uniref:T9SS type B sorting domain-containing protein n=1 Tax=Dysgonomonas sp. ZJ279 TaxID=2709796 RepID=UPI0013EB29B1|nr:gliding motility-associated C-terminal domain-containing protein [Dysgonomonas sp. ZJ279]